MKKKTKQKIVQAVLVVLFHVMCTAMFMYGIMTATTLR